MVGQGIYGHEVVFYQLFEADYFRVIVYLYRLSMAGSSADIFIAWVLSRAVGIANLCPNDAIKLIKELLRSPESTSCQINRLHRVLLFAISCFIAVKLLYRIVLQMKSPIVGLIIINQQKERSK